MPKNLRQQRLSGEIHKYLADILRTFAEQVPDLKDVLIELTEVRLTPDLQQVRAYILTYSSDRAAFIVRLLRQYQKEIRYALSQQIRHLVKVMPTVHFYVDETQLHARRIEEVLKKLPPASEEH